MTATALRVDATTVRAFWEALCEPGEVREVRIPKPKDPPAGKPRFYGVQSGYFDDVDALISAIGTITGEDAEAVYITLNPVRPELLGRAANRLVRSKTSTADADVTALRCFLIDVDANRPAGISATDAEKMTALLIREAVRDYLGWTPAVIADTGNGGALIYWIDLPNDAESIELLKRVLDHLGEIFDTEDAHVDRGNFNPSRLVKVSGTIAAKGDALDERPWRVSTAAFPEDAAIVTRKQLLRLAGPARKQSAAKSNGTRPERSWSVDELLALNSLDALPRRTGYGTAYDLDRCLTSTDHVDGACIIEMDSGALVYRCQHNRCAGKDWNHLREEGLIKIPGEQQARLVGLAPGPASPSTAPPTEPGTAQAPISLNDFHAYLPEHKYIFAPLGKLWPAASVNERLGKVGRLTAATWLDRNQAVEQMTWAPGEPELIEGKLLDAGGWIHRSGVRSFNLYRRPTIELGDADQAGRWVEHVYRLYPVEAEHLIDWFAHRVQRPGEKINHALVLGGSQGIGKDTLLEPVAKAVGEWNVEDVTPAQMLGRFNGFVKSVLLRVSEARDLGDSTRYAFYDHLKLYTAAPPDVLRCDEKNVREYTVLNVCGLVLTTNHKTDGIYLPADDRRHFVAWSEVTEADFERDYFDKLYGWYAAGGFEHVAAYLQELDISAFNAKAPPPKTSAFWDIVDANRAPEDSELADVLDRLSWPDVVTVRDIIDACYGDDFADWLKDRRNSRQIPYRMEAAGYVAVRNQRQTDGRWKVGGKNVVIYARETLPTRDRLQMAEGLATDQRSP